MPGKQKRGSRTPKEHGEGAKPPRGKLLRGEAATPAQMEDARRLTQSWGPIRHMLKVRIHLLETAPEGTYDSDREAYNLAIPYYAVWASKKVYEAAKEKGDSKSYGLFISLMNQVSELMKVELFTISGDELVERFGVLKAHLDKCARHLNTPSYGFEEVWEKFRFSVKAMGKGSRTPYAPEEGAPVLDKGEEYVPGI